MATPIPAATTPRTIQQLFDLTGKTALVTGGSRGLPPRPAIDATLMMRPEPCGIMLCLAMCWLKMK